MSNQSHHGDGTTEPLPSSADALEMLKQVVGVFDDMLAESRAGRESLEASHRALEAERRAAQAEQRKQQRWSLLLKALFFGTPVILGLLWFGFAVITSGLRFGPFADVVGVVRISGTISSTTLASADKVVPALEKAFAHPRVKAVVLAIDSPGGAPVEAERINDAIRALRAKHPKPLVAVIENVGASAAFLVGVHADELIAGRYSLVGSIGAVMTSWDIHKLADRLSVSQRIYTSGRLKAMLNPFVPSTEEADRKAQSLVAGMGRAFVDEVFQARNGKISAALDFGTGEVWSGSEALEIGLIDRIGTLDEVVWSKWALPAFQFGPQRQRSLFGASTDSWSDRMVEQLLHLVGPQVR